MTSKCAFCDVVAGRVPAHIVYTSAEAVAFLDKSPLQYGHLLLVPREHIETLPELPAAQVGTFFQAAQLLAVAVERALAAEGTFVALNNKVSQSVPHLHVHIVPRRKGDGLKGFFWPRKKYAGGQAEEVAARVKAAIGN